MRTLLLLLCSCFLAEVTAQWSYSATASAGLSYVEDAELDSDKNGGLYGLGAQIAYDFGGRIGQVSLGLGYEQYRDFSVSQRFSLNSTSNTTQFDRNDIQYRTSIEGWHALRINIGIEGPFVILADDGPLRMFVNGGLMVTGGADYYGVQVMLPDSTGNFPAEDKKYTVYDGTLVDDGRQQSPLRRVNLLAGFGLAYRLTPTLTVSAMYEKSFAPIGRKYGGEYVDPFDGYREPWHKYHFGEIRNLRLGLAVQVF